MPVETEARGRAVGGARGRRTIGRPAAAARGWAILSLAAGLALTVVLVVFLVRNGIFLVVGLIGLALSVVGGWWVVAERMPRRAVGFLALVLGAVVQVVALLRAGNEDLTSLLLLVVALVLSPSPSWRRRRRSARTCADGVADVHHAPRPRHAVLLCNPWSGGGKVEKFGLVGRANSLGVETVLLDHGLDLEALARGAVADGADCLGMAGGDGSQALVASIAVRARPAVRLRLGRDP